MFSVFAVYLQAAWAKMGKPDLNKNYIKESALGSLPKPMTALQRNSVTPLSSSAVTDAIKSVPPVRTPLID